MAKTRRIQWEIRGAVRVKKGIKERIPKIWHNEFEGNICFIQEPMDNPAQFLLTTDPVKHSLCGGFSGSEIELLDCFPYMTAFHNDPNVNFLRR